MSKTSILGGLFEHFHWLSGPLFGGVQNAIFRTMRFWSFGVPGVCSKSRRLQSLTMSSPHHPGKGADPHLAAKRFLNPMWAPDLVWICLFFFPPHRRRAKSTKQQGVIIGSAKADRSGCNRGFGEGLLKDKLAFFEAFIRILYLRGENCLENTHFYKQKGPCEKKNPLIYTEQMDAEGLGRKLLLTPSGDPRATPKSRPWVLWPHLTKC